MIGIVMMPRVLETPRIWQAERVWPRHGRELQASGWRHHQYKRKILSYGRADILMATVTGLLLQGADAPANVRKRLISEATLLILGITKL
jgi:hypothetical protein